MTGPNSDDKLWGGLSYAGLACCMIPTVVIFLLKKGESSFIKFHSLQALGVGLASIVTGIIFSVIGGVAGNIVAIAIVVGLANLIVSLAILGLWLYLMIVTFMGKDIKLPVLGDFIDQNLMAS